MHSLVLLTALSATTGLFGGGRQCPNGQCAGAAWTYQQAPVSYYQPYAPTVYAAPAPQVAAPAPAAPAVQAAPQPAYFSAGYYYVYPTTASCPTGNCPYR